MRFVVDQFAESLQTNATIPPAAAGLSLHYLAKGLATLLEKAQRELDSNREAAKASLVTASSILRSEIERSSGANGSRPGASAGWQIARVRAFIEENLHSNIDVRDSAARSVLDRREHDGTLDRVGGRARATNQPSKRAHAGPSKSVITLTTTTYAYDPFGNRISQATASSTTWYPNKFVSITNATSSNSATSTDYLYSGSTLFETVDQPLVNGLATGSPVTRYIHTDNLGSTNITSDANQNRAQWFDYAPYGSVIASTNTGTTTDARQYIGQYTDNTGLSYLNARYYNPTQGQFLSEDPVFWGQQNLGDPESLNAYSYSENNPIVKSAPSGKCLEDACVGEALIATSPEWSPYAISAMSAGFSIAGTYLSNYLAHQPTTPLEVAVSAGSGALSPSVFGNGFSGLFISGLLTPAAEDAASNRKLDLGGDTLSGLTDVGTFGVFRWGAGLSPLELAAGKSALNPSSQAIISNLRYETVLNTFQTSSGVVAQNSYSHSSFSGGVQQAQNYISSAVQSGAAKIGNAIGGFVGTFNVGSGVGTYNVGTGKWAK